jgi:hypothetical protein
VCQEILSSLGLCVKSKRLVIGIFENVGRLFILERKI